MAAIRQLYRDDPQPCDRETLLGLLKDHFGFGKLGPRIRERLEGDVIAAVKRGILVNERGVYGLHCRTITDYDRDFLKKMVLSALTPVWQPRDEAIDAVARHLGYQRTGKTIRETIDSALRGLMMQGAIEHRNNRTEVRKA